MGGPKQAKEIRADDYMAAQLESHRPTMESLRALVRSVVPEAMEKISYGILAYKHHYMLVGIGATRSGVSLHTMSPSLVSSMKAKFSGVKLSGATLHFSAGESLPTALIIEVIRHRVRENEERAASQSVARNTAEHRAIALRSAKRAKQVLPLYEDEHPSDHRPRQAIEAIEAWAKEEQTLGMAEVRRLSLAAHAAAREATSDSARFAARAAGHAVATWHVPNHAEGALTYAAKAESALASDPKGARS